MAKKGYIAEVERKEQLELEGFHVTRNSGSIGANDLIAVKNCIPQEVIDAGLCSEIKFDVRYEQVKKTREKTFYFNEDSKYELSRLKEISEKFKIPCFFAIKFTYKGWKIINVNDLDGSPIKWQ